MMKISPLAGKPAESGRLVNVPQLVTAYYTGIPDYSVPAQRVAFGTSGHRGSAFENTFNEWHILAITPESFRGEDHLCRILEEAQSIVKDALTEARIPLEQPESFPRRSTPITNRP
jgi:hypothetical protein